MEFDTRLTVRGRKPVPTIRFNGKNVTETVSSYLTSLSYTDVASGESDSIDLTFHNVGMKWLKNWYPVKGDRIAASINFKNWYEMKTSNTYSCGSFVLDSIGFQGGPIRMSLGALAVPVKDAFKATSRTVTWKNITIREIAKKIADRYGLKLSYDAGSVTIENLEQNDQTDSAFLYELCKTYGLAMKVYSNRIIIYDKGEYEKKKTVVTLTRSDFLEDEWDYSDSLIGTYTGANISYQGAADDEEIKTYVGFSEKGSSLRTLNITEKADNLKDAKLKAAARVNEENEKTTTLSGKIQANPKITAACNVQIEGMGKINGKYFIDKVVTEVGESGSSMSLEMHRIQERLSYLTVPKKTTSKTTSQKSADTEKKSYQVGDIVNFHGGTHYVSSYPGAAGSSAKAGPAKITIANGSGKAHPWHLQTTDWSKSNVYGWVDNGTFD